MDKRTGREQRPGCALHEPELFEGLPVPLAAGLQHGEDVVIERVNRAFREHWGTPRLPCSVRELFIGAQGPVRAEPFLEAVRRGGARATWEVVPGEMIVDLALFSGEEGEFAACLPDLSDRLIVRRLEDLREKADFLLRIHPVREVLPVLAQCITESLQLEWAGILQWNPQEERWTLLASEAGAVSRDAFERALAFLDALKTANAASGSSLGGLSVEEGEKWSIRWPQEGGTWREMLSKAGFRSLFAATLLTGATPMLLVCLSEREGGLARINGEAVHALWPILSSTAERYRVVAGMSAISERDAATGLIAPGATRRHLTQELDRARRYKYVLSLVQIELRNVSALRARSVDLLDDAMRFLAREANRSIRTVDTAGRVTENAILLILPHTPDVGCRVVVERLRERIAGLSPLPGTALDVDFRNTSFDEGNVPNADGVISALQTCAVPLS